MIQMLWKNATAFTLSQTSFIELMELSHRFNWLHLGIAAAKRVTENSIYYFNLILCYVSKN